jgi:hypothetical protein
MLPQELQALRVRDDGPPNKSGVTLVKDSGRLERGPALRLAED